MRWNLARGKQCVIWCQTSRGREDSARAPRMKRRTGGGEGRRPAMVESPPEGAGCRVYRSAGKVALVETEIEI